MQNNNSILNITLNCVKRILVTYKDIPNVLNKFNISNAFNIFDTPNSPKWIEQMNDCKFEFARVKSNKNNNNVKKINSNISSFMLTHKIDEKYSSILYFKNNIDNIFRIAIWDIMNAITIYKNGKYYYDPVEYHTLIHLIDVFAILSRLKTKEEFTKDYINEYKINNNDNINEKDIPINILNDWKKPLDCLLTSSLTRLNYNADKLYANLCNKFVPNIITFNDINDFKNINNPIMRNPKKQKNQLQNNNQGH